MSDPTTVIVYHDGYVDPDDLDRVAKQIGGEVALLPVNGSPSERVQVITDDDGLRIVSHTPVEVVGEKQDRSRRDRPISIVPEEGARTIDDLTPEEIERHKAGARITLSAGDEEGSDDAA
jgi:hypothetical protein